MTVRPLTLMAVHAHPDDEATSTGGVLVRYAAEGVTTVLVTCTDGRCGDGPGGVKPGAPGHDPAAVAEMRRAELEASCAALKVTRLELLGYADSGMMGWPTNDAPGTFWTTPVPTPRTGWRRVPAGGLRRLALKAAVPHLGDRPHRALTQLSRVPEGRDRPGG
jgi:LmbE family N-acetylglucosaminyl deacetylase